MKRFLIGFLAFAGASALVTCSDVTDTLAPEGTLDPGSASLSVSADVPGDPVQVDGFFFLPPLVPTPEFSGIADNSLEPLVTICRWDPAEGEDGECISNGSNPDQAVFSLDAVDSDFRLSMDPGQGYSGVWKTTAYPAPEGEVFRIAVTVFGQILGSLDVKSYDQQGYNSFRNSGDPQGYTVVSDNGSANIKFRIEDGAVESAFCDDSDFEDCDVRVFTPEEEGCLTVLDQPEGSSAGFLLGSQACVRGGSAVLGPEVEQFVVVMTLEDEGTDQGEGEPKDWQVPYFPDVRTFPDGLTFQGGVSVTICQVDGLDHPPGYLRPFAILANGETVLPEFYSEIGDHGAEGEIECGEVLPNPDLNSSIAAAERSGETPILQRLAGTLQRASRFFLPAPLHARRRLHGGLNTVVWKLSEDGDAAASFESIGPQRSSGDPGSSALELGALVDVDPFRTVVSFSPEVLPDEVVEIQVEVRNLDGDPFPLELPVTVDAEYGSVGTIVTWDGGAYSYTATYTAPSVEGDDFLTVTVDGVEVPGSPFRVTILEEGLVVRVVIDGGAPADGLPIHIYPAEDPVEDDPLFSLVTVLENTESSPSDPSVGFAIETQAPFGAYIIHIPKRDFDMAFTSMTEAKTHNQRRTTVTFYATTVDIPETAEIFRVRNPFGTGNVYQYIPNNRSWTSANNQIRDDILESVPGHLATAANPVMDAFAAENSFIAALFKTDPNLCPLDTDPKKCKTRGWIGLTDEVTEGTFEWVTWPDELTDWFNWKGTDGGNRANRDHVEIGPDGLWTVINGASSTNDGYFVEWDVPRVIFPH